MSDGGIELRPMREEEIPSLEIVRRQAIEAGYTEVNEYDRSEFAAVVANPDENLREWCESDGHVALVAENEITQVGYGVYDSEESEVLALYTASAHQGHGCGTELMRRFEDQAAEEDAGTITVVSPLNAVGFFESRGYERVETVEENGIEKTVLEKEI